MKKWIQSQSRRQGGHHGGRGEYSLDGGFGAWLPVESVGDDYGCSVTSGGGITWDVFDFWGSVVVVCGGAVLYQRLDCIGSRRILRTFWLGCVGRGVPVLGTVGPLVVLAVDRGELWVSIVGCLVRAVPSVGG